MRLNRFVKLSECRCGIARKDRLITVLALKRLHLQLRRNEAVVNALLLHQLVVRADLRDVVSVNYNETVRIFNTPKRAFLYRKAVK